MRSWLGLVAVAAVLGVAGYTAKEAYVRWVPPAAGEARGEEQAAMDDVSGRFSGRLVWSSNRTGNHEIHLLELRDGRPRLLRLTDHPNVDTFPRFSPDGSRILFNRSRRPWVSFRELDDWDVWVMNADGSGARLVAERGYHASFTRSGRSAVFTRGTTIVRASIDRPRERQVIDAGKTLGGTAWEPDLRGKELALTLRGGRRTFGVYNLRNGRFRELEGPACQMFWWPGRKSLVWVENRGHGGNRLRTGGADGSGVETLLDLPGTFSHEYFPRLDRSGSWLVLGASEGGHEHDRADYEIFLWKVGTPAGEALRVTHHSGNDQWPDVIAGG